MSERNNTPAKMPRGFLFSGIHCGLKNSEELDLALIRSTTVCRTAGVFTLNHFPGEPVKLGREVLKNGELQAIVINSKISNVATGSAGYEQARSISHLLADHLGIDKSLSLISSTGVIGQPYPHMVIENALEELIKSNGTEQEHALKAATAMMTTDTVPKLRSLRVGNANITMLAKGSGMIAPNMATMLAFICTDAELPQDKIGPILKSCVDKSLNNISIDFDMSTSDTCILMANGQAGPVDCDEFEEALTALSQEISLDLVKDGEGVDHVIHCAVSGAPSSRDAREVASSVINSPLVKTMITGADPNWGRLIMAIGKSQTDCDLSLCKPDISLCGQMVFSKGKPCSPNLQELSVAIKKSDIVDIQIDLHLGSEKIELLGANLSHEYVSINADYTT